MESQIRGPLHGGQADGESEPPKPVNAGEDPNPATQSISVTEAANADARPQGAAAAPNPPRIPLAPLKRVQARFNPLADGLMYLVVFVGGFVGVGLRRVLDVMMPAAEGQPFVPGTFVSNMLACLLFAMLVEYMTVASWLPRRIRQITSRGLGLGLLGGLSTMSGLMLEAMEGMRTHHVAGALLYLAISFIGGVIASAMGVGLMQLLLARRTRRTVREALQVSDSPESDTQEAGRRSRLSDSGESDKLAAQDAPPEGYMQVKVADAAHSAAQAALEAAAAAQAAATTAAQAAQSESLESQESPVLAELAGVTRRDNPAPSEDLPSFEPKPVTAEIPLVADPTTGEVR
ncbi:fluoride efflux transporter FluC [Bifidobacterium moukalabense]|uniref:fluoride efflux transporter FluC n=1 Tax=Bifidobacterium moukalabense TaxID=1333651 RepID=UPI0010F7E1DA|nr:CrcB family protein [Bifidobacterium moukalabense]